jgi:hypothetical protein
MTQWLNAEYRVDAQPIAFLLRRRSLHSVESLNQQVRLARREGPLFRTACGESAGARRLRKSGTTPAGVVC